MRHLIFLGTTSLALCCAGTLSNAAQSTDAQPAEVLVNHSDTVNTGTPLYTRQDVPGSVEGREVAEVTLDEIKPAFTEATVLTLNAIVRRSLQAAGHYTRSIKSVRTIVATSERPGASPADRDAARAALEQLRTLHERAVAARIDMDAAVTSLEASAESYSEELLAGMVQYVRDVETSIAAEIQRLDSTQRSGG